MKTKVKIYATILSLWIAVGIISTAYTYVRANQPEYKKLQAETLWLRVKVKTRTEFMEKLPVLFTKFPSVGGILYLNEKMSLLGSAHEPDRLSSPDYKLLLKAYTGKEAMPGRLRNRLHSITLPDQSRVSLYLQRTLSWAAWYRAMGMLYPNLEIMISAYLFILILFALGLLIARQPRETPKLSHDLPEETLFTESLPDSESFSEQKVPEEKLPHENFSEKRAPEERPAQEIPEKKKPQNPLLRLFTKDKSTPKASKKGPETSKKQHPKSPKAPKSPSSELHFTERIYSLLDVMNRSYPLSCVTFYTTENGRWEGVVTKSGQIMVRGELFTELAPELMNKAKEEPWLIFPGEDQKPEKVLISLLHRGHLIGGILAVLSSGQKATEEMCQELYTLAGEYAQSVFVQRLYDLAVNDSETGFYTYPYLYSVIKEKLQSSQHFAAVLFEVDPVESLSPETLRRWSEALAYGLKKEKLKPALIARLARGKFVLLYHLHHEHSLPHERRESEIEAADLEGVLSYVRQLSASHLGKKSSLFGGFLIKPAVLKDTDDFFRRLEYLLINSRVEEKFLSRPVASKPAPVFGRTG